MPFVAPLPSAEITDPELRDLIARCGEVGVPGDLFTRMVARAPEQAKPLLRVMLVKFAEGNVDHKLKEIIRILLARFAEDPYFSALRSKQAQAAGLTEDDIEAGVSDYEDSPRFSEAEKCALRFADQLYLDSSKVDGAFYDELKKHYTEPQIMELGAFIALFYAVHLVMRALLNGPEPTTH